MYEKVSAFEVLPLFRYNVQVISTSFPFHLHFIKIQFFGGGGERLQHDFFLNR